MSNVRSSLSTPPVAKTESLYLFQSCVSTSAGDVGAAGGAGPAGEAGGAWTGIVATRWYLAEDGVRMSKRRTCESDEAAEMRAGFEGQKAVLYVQFPMGRVLREKFRVGDHCKTSADESVCFSRLRTYNLHCAVPGAGYKCVLCDRVPSHGEGLAFVLVETHYREVLCPQIEQLKRTIAASNNQLVLIDLGPCQVVKRIVRIEAIGRRFQSVNVI
jgi:hypothetical protein